tara:strand:- start:760 stop:1131 length:372 start_codon:yes stop_codon:yes gene_type:complete
MRGFVLLSLLHAAVSFVVPAVPGWRMFSHVEALRYRMVTAEGEVVRYDDVAPLPHYITNPAPLLGAAAWLADHEGREVGLSLRGDRTLDLVVAPSGTIRACGREPASSELCATLLAAWREDPP